MGDDAFDGGGIGLPEFERPKQLFVPNLEEVLTVGNVGLLEDLAHDIVVFDRANALEGTEGFVVKEVTVFETLVLPDDLALDLHVLQVFNREVDVLVEEKGLGDLFELYLLEEVEEVDPEVHVFEFFQTSDSRAFVFVEQVCKNQLKFSVGEHYISIWRAKIFRIYFNRRN